MEETAVAANPPALPALDNTLGAIILGTFGAMLCQGVIYHQGFQYFRLYPTNDARILKVWVTVMLILETINCVLTLHICYAYMIEHYFDPAYLLAAPVWSMKILPLPACLSAVITEGFFARRVWLVSPPSRPLVVLAVMLEFAFFGCYLAISVTGWNASNAAIYLNHTWLVALGSGFVGLANVMMTSVLIHVLRRGRTGIKRTNWTIDMLIRYAFGTGLLLCVFEVVNIIVSTVWSRSLIFLPICIILTKISSSSFLVALNIRNELSATEVTGIDPFSQFTSTMVYRNRPLDVSSPKSSGLRGNTPRVTGTGQLPESIELTVLSSGASRHDGDNKHFGSLSNAV
ncbi:hypothetical protein C8Q76DRAFT_750225 [Earliella scabrosa]|nr:hypothetical protein C8Q76DRAFT_750225 [Earliella scabrosa]